MGPFVLGLLQSKIVTYDGDGITGSKSENVSAGDNAGAGGLNLSFGVVDDFVPSEEKVGAGGLLGARAINENGGVATLNKTVVKVHSE